MWSYTILAFNTLFICVLILLIWHLKLLKNPKKHLAPLISISSLVAYLFFTSMQTIYLLNAKPEPDYLKLNQPYLQPTLIVDSVDKSGITFHYVIRNIGNLPAEKLDLVYLSPMNSGKRSSGELGPKSEMKFAPYSLEKSSISRKDYHKGYWLYVLYSSEIYGVKKNFTSSFYFGQLDNKIEKGAYAYEDAYREEKLLTPSEITKLLDIEANLDEVSGLFTFWFTESKQEQSSPSFLAKSKTQTIIYNPIKKSIAYAHTFKNNRICFIEDSLNEAAVTDRHFVAINWSAKECSFFIDGVSKGNCPQK